MSDPVILGIVAACVSVLTPITGVIVAYYLAKIKAATDQAVKLGESTHVLVNSQRGETLKALAVALRVIASDRPTTVNLAAATAAEKASVEHDGQQAKVDAKG